MKAYVYEEVADLTDGQEHYHRGGGALVVTAGDPLKLLPEDAFHEERVDGEWEKVRPKYSAAYDVPDGTPERVFIFPDAGCC